MGKHVLVIDDEPDTLDTLEDFLALHGYAVHRASNGREALDALTDLPEPPCFLLVDLNMPVMDGWELIEKLQPMGEVDPARICIATSSPEKAPGGYPVLAKPVRLSAVLNAVQGSCGRP